MEFPLLKNADVKNKRVLVRGDIDVPAGENFRLEAMKPTIDYLLQQNCQVILCGHRGRPTSPDPALSTKPIQGYFPNIKVLENLRFDPREEANDESLAKELAAIADIYVNEAFATCERAHASIVGVPKLLPHYAGFRLAKEIEVLGKVMENPDRPMLTILSGAKPETKIPLIMSMAKISETVLVGGRLIGAYMCGNWEELKRIQVINLTDDGKDAKLDSLDEYQNLIAKAKTIIWNGPLGRVEEINYQVGTRRLAELITTNTQAYKVVGGGDTVAFINKLGLADKFNWVSTGGGSMLKFLAGEELPGIKALYD